MEIAHDGTVTLRRPCLSTIFIYFFIFTFLPYKSPENFLPSKGENTPTIIWKKNHIASSVAAHTLLFYGCLCSSGIAQGFQSSYTHCLFYVFAPSIPGGEKRKCQIQFNTETVSIYLYISRYRFF